jgi:serine/threonine protein kinase
LIGKTLSNYEVREQIGAGGMGEVYLARDTRLGRDVALKLLPPVFSGDPERVGRFEREAKLLASLNHPHIGAIHGLERAGSNHFLVLELVDGEDLSQRLGRGPFEIEEALALALQITQALEAAHEQGVVHRDLKPANVKVTPEGRVKVLDFGLAKALETDGAPDDISHSPTVLHTGGTVQGVILGTAAYMSPEQARGKAVDRRADIWAFGCVLYEMLTGRQTFEGETVSDTLASVLKSEPDWSALPDGIPAAVRRLLRRCLEKDPRRRLRDIGEARIVLENVIEGRADEEVPLAAAATPPGKPTTWRLALAGLAILVPLAALASWMLKPSGPEPPLRKFDVTSEDASDDPPHDARISPDGRSVAFVRGDRLWVRDLDQLESREMDGTDGALAPFWSPDGTHLGYLASSRIWKIPVGGGRPVSVCDAQGDFVGGRGGTWAADDRIVFSRGNTGLLEVPAVGGDATVLLELDASKESDLHQPCFLPDGKSVLFVVHRLEGGPDTIDLLTENGRKRLLQLPGQIVWDPVYSGTGHILFHRSPTNAGIWALPFSHSKLEVTGEAFLVTPDGDEPSVSQDGTLAMRRGGGALRRQLVWVNREGQVEEVLSEPLQGVITPVLSPDGRRAAYSASEGENRDIWINDLARGTRTRFTFEASIEWSPAWSADGGRVAWSGIGGSIMWKAADGTGAIDTLARGMGPSFTKDGTRMVYSLQGENTRTDLWYVELDAKEEPVVFLQTPARERNPDVSPDGEYVAFESNETGRNEIYIKRFPSGEGKWQVSVNGGFWPRWSGSGDRLFFREGESIMEVDVTFEPSLTLGTPREVFSGGESDLVMAGWLAYDVTADGNRFLMLQDVTPEDTHATVTVVQNWFSEFASKN